MGIESGGETTLPELVKALEREGARDTVRRIDLPAPLDLAGEGRAKAKSLERRVRRRRQDSPQRHRHAPRPCVTSCPVCFGARERMSDSTCPDCGQPLPADAPAGMCPACLLRLGESATAPEPEDLGSLLDSAQQPDASAGEIPSARAARYKLLEIIGEGGFGTVWMAEQQEPVRR